jgi:hypothetical protein
MLNFCGGRHFHIGRHNTAHKFNIVRFQCPELIPDIEKFLPVAIFKMAVTISQKFNIVYSEDVYG